MRDIALTAAILGSVPFILRYPFVGVLVWAWIAIQAPHQDVWGFSQSMPFNLIVAATTVIAWMTSKDRRMPPSDTIYWLFIAFLLWVTMSSFFAVAPKWSWQYWDRCWKTIFLGLFAAAMATNKVRLHALMWVIVISLFYYGVKGGVFTLITGGQYHVMGPPNSVIGDNNCLALALLMTLPLANYLRLQTRNIALQWGILAAMGFTVISIIGSYSRGALLGLGALLLYGIMRTRHRFLYLAVIAALVVPVFNFMPEQFHDRVHSISEADEDASFMGRVAAWKVAIDCATDFFPFGAGFYGPQRPELFHKYLPDEEAHAAHSIYFQVLGEHGFIGLAIYLMLIASAFLSTWRIRKAVRDVPEQRWIHEMVTMIEISLVGFCVGGAALSLAYYDVFVLIVAMLLPIKQMVRSTAAAKKAARRTLVEDGVPAIA